MLKVICTEKRIPIKVWFPELNLWKTLYAHVVRESNGQHLGGRHFELIEQVAEEMLDFLLVNSVVSDDCPPLVEDRELRSSQESSASPD